MNIIFATKQLTTNLLSPMLAIPTPIRVKSRRLASFKIRFRALLISVWSTESCCLCISRKVVLNQSSYALPCVLLIPW